MELPLAMMPLQGGHAALCPPTIVKVVPWEHSPFYSLQMPDMRLQAYLLSPRRLVIANQSLILYSIAR